MTLARPPVDTGTNVRKAGPLHRNTASSGLKILGKVLCKQHNNLIAHRTPIPGIQAMQMIDHEQGRVEGPPFIGTVGNRKLRAAGREPRPVVTSED